MHATLCELVRRLYSLFTLNWPVEVYIALECTLVHNNYGLRYAIRDVWEKLVCLLEGTYTIYVAGFERARGIQRY